MPIAKIYQDGKYVNEVQHKSHRILATQIVLFKDENKVEAIAHIPASMMVIFKPDGHVDYDKAEKELRERKV